MMQVRFIFHLSTSAAMTSFLIDSSLALLGLLIGGVGGYAMFVFLFAGDVAYSVFQVLGLFVGVFTAGVGGILGANLRIWISWSSR
jgi:hypothetical protein